MDQAQTLSNSQLFASWAGEDVQSWEQAIGTSVTHVSRGAGTVSNVSREAGNIAVHVQYTRAVHAHALWEFRTEIRNMTLPTGLTRADLLPATRERQKQQAEDKRAAQEARLILMRQRRNIS
ncbi:MAG: hypothetical protein AB7R89_14485 [Dehalococcoidia bacterium]